MTDWIIPLVSGAVFFIMSTVRMRARLRGRPLGAFGRVLRAYGTIYLVGEGYLFLILRSLLQGTTEYANISVFAVSVSVVWAGVPGLIGVLRYRRGGVKP